MANIQQVVNQTVSGVRVRSKMVPAVTDVRMPQPEHQNRPPPSRQPPSSPQPGQTNPVGQRINEVIEAVRVGGEPGLELAPDLG